MNVNLAKASGKHYQQGFTLIEILVASLILFSSLSVVSLVYKGSYLSSEKATTTIVLSGTIRQILSSVSRIIKENGNKDLELLEGEGMSWGVEYSWKAELSMFTNAPQTFDPDSGQMVDMGNKYKLWKVSIETKIKNTTSEYQFYELSWNDT